MRSKAERSSSASVVNQNVRLPQCIIEVDKKIAIASGTHGKLFTIDKYLFREAVKQMRKSFVDDYSELAKKNKVPKILLYLSTQTPSYDDDFSGSFVQTHQGFPHFINSSTIECILPQFDEYVELISSRGFPRKLISRFTGKPTTNSKGNAYNDYYASSEMHEYPLQMLLPISSKYVS